MSFGDLALIGLIAMLGPLLALPSRWHLPVLLGEFVAGIGFGQTGWRVLPHNSSTFDFLANVGFGLIMFVTGTRVPLRDPRMRTGAGRRCRRARSVSPRWPSPSRSGSRRCSAPVTRRSTRC